MTDRSRPVSSGTAPVQSLATSIDGRTFSFHASLDDLPFRVGGYVVQVDGDDAWLGQVLTLELGLIEVSPVASTPGPELLAVRRVAAAVGTGTTLGEGRSFHDVPLTPATEAQVNEWQEASLAHSAALEVGQFANLIGVPALIDPQGFDRHTFLCGQSGSGKTYSLGVILEHLLMDTELRVLVLDPNSDFVRLGTVRDGSEGPITDSYRDVAANIEVRRSESSGGLPLRIRVSELSPAARAAMLQLDPVDDREEYAALAELLEHDEGGRPLIGGIGELLTSELPGARPLGLRAANLGVLDWGTWERGAGGSLHGRLLDDDWRCLVVDLGSLDTPEEQAVIAESVLDTLWRHRRDRRPVLIVIDEAHNVCPQFTESGVVALATRHAVQIAAEGRKFGLHLLVSTQRPQKVHDNVLSQCDNLVLMRMNSAADLGHLVESFSFVPPSMFDEARHFGLGEALIAGKVSPNPTLVRFGARISEEGGADVVAAPRRDGPTDGKAP
jgi:DNA helicase HerA-like ATPase